MYICMHIHHGDMPIMTSNMALFTGTILINHENLGHPVCRELMMIVCIFQQPIIHKFHGESLILDS